MIPTGKLYGWLLLGLAIAIPMGILSPQKLLTISLILLGYDGLILGLAAWDNQLTKQRRVDVEPQPVHRLAINRDNPIVLTVRSGYFPADLQIRDGYPPELEVSTPTLNARLSSHDTQELTYTVRPHQRGEFLWGAIQVRQLSPSKLVWHSWKIPADRTVVVYPDLIGLRSLSIRLTLETTGSIRRAKRLGTGTEFAELRKYDIGDDLRFVDWKATARRGQPLVRVLEPDLEQTLIILLDRGRLMTARVKGLTRFDWGLNATLALALAGLHRGDRVGVGVFDRQIHTWIPPERGQHQLNHLIERLSPIQPVLLEPDYLGAVTALVNQQTRRALVVLLTDLVDSTASAELLAALSKLTPRYLPFCVTLRDPQVDQQAHTLTQTVPATYARAVALDLLTQRQIAFATLKQKGVLVLDAPADQISDQLVDRYLQIKARNQL
jgi:uncharacterized protein (DUF58 family)